MSILPNSIKRRWAFIDELCLFKEIDPYEIEYLREMVGKGEHAFWEALHHVCGEQSAVYILEMAEKSVGMVEHGYKEIMEFQGEPMMDWGDIALIMIEWYMIAICAQELAQCESRTLYERVKQCAEQTKGYVEDVIKHKTLGAFKPEVKPN